MSNGDPFTLSCPIPFSEYPQILMAHGGGGRLMGQLIERIFAAAFGLPEPSQRHDSAILYLGDLPLEASEPEQYGPKSAAPNSETVTPADRLQKGARRPDRLQRHTRCVAVTTDSFVVKPLFFPGGDIGSLAVNGTVNDLSMAGASPIGLTVGFILEEGLPMETLWRVACSMRAAADAAGVRIVTGDTKVVDRGKGDGVYINTSGVGVFNHNMSIGPSSIRPGDAILLSGDIGRHGVAIMATREGLEFETTIESDCAPLVSPVRRLIEGGIDIHCLRDLTRGGMASALVELADAANVEITIEETLIPVKEEVSAACEILGLDPLYVANEGCFVAFVPADQAEKALTLLRQDPITPHAVQIGSVTAPGERIVLLKTRIGSERIVDLLSGEQLPRIC